MFELPWWKIELTTAEHVLPQCVCDTGVSFCLPSLSVGSNKSHGGKLCGIIFNGAVWQVQPICSTVIICFEPSKMFILSEMNMSLICPKTYQIIRDILNLMDFPSKTNAPVGCFGPSPSKSVFFDHQFGVPHSGWRGERGSTAVQIGAERRDRWAKSGVPCWSYSYGVPMELQETELGQSHSRFRWKYRLRSPKNSRSPKLLDLVCHLPQPLRLRLATRD